MRKIFMLLTAMLVTLACIGCSEDTLDYNNPDVKLFVKQLRAGTYNTKNTNGVVEVPLFTSKHIPQLLMYSEDMTEIPSFPLPSISSQLGGKARLGECMLWVVENIRLGQTPSLGCKLVHHDADNYEGIFFLSNEEVLEAATLYRRWWEKVESVPVEVAEINWTCDPLEESKYRWW